jgi:formylglycine-generating enzyme required for sulfatase activity
VLGYNVLKPGFDQTGWNPAVCVTWDEAQAYAAWLSKTTGRRYRLPSAAEWEFAARARGDGPFHTGGLITQEQARIALDRKKAGSVQVGSFSSNSFGLHDVHGNAAEWVEDCWHSSLHGMPKDGSAWKQQVGCERVVKGGAWYDAPGATRLAARMPAAPTLASNGIGFRIAREID